MEMALRFWGPKHLETEVVIFWSRSALGNASLGYPCEPSSGEARWEQVKVDRRGPKTEPWGITAEEVRGGGPGKEDWERTADVAEGSPGEYGSWKKQHAEGREQANQRLPTVFLRLCCGGSPEAVRGWGGYKQRNDANPVTPNMLYIFECIFGQSWVTICK